MGVFGEGGLLGCVCVGGFWVCLILAFSVFLLSSFFSVHEKSSFCIRVRVMVISATFNNISVMSRVSFISGGKRSTRRKLPTCHTSLINFVT